MRFHHLGLSCLRRPGLRSKEGIGKIRAVRKEALPKRKMPRGSYPSEAFFFQKIFENGKSSATSAGDLFEDQRRLGQQRAESATRHAGQFAIGAAGEDDGDLCADHNSGGERAGEVLQLLEEDVASLQIGHH